MVTNVTILFGKNKGSSNYFHYLSVDYMHFQIIWLEKTGITVKKNILHKVFRCFFLGDIPHGEHTQSWVKFKKKFFESLLVVPKSNFSKQVFKKFISRFHICLLSHFPFLSFLFFSHFSFPFFPFLLFFPFFSFFSAFHYILPPTSVDHPESTTAPFFSSSLSSPPSYSLQVLTRCKYTYPLPRPTVAVKVPVVDGFRQVCRFNLFTPLQIGHGARHLENTVIRTGRESKPLHGCFQQLQSCAVG